MTVMTRTIEFDSKLGFLAKEIHDAIADRVLSTKLYTCGFAGAQTGPKALFYQSRIFPKIQPSP